MTTDAGIDLGTYWWKRAKAGEQAAAAHCETTLRRGSEIAAEPHPRNVELWEAFGIGWQAVRDRIDRELTNT